MQASWAELQRGAEVKTAQEDRATMEMVEADWAERLLPRTSQWWELDGCSCLCGLREGATRAIFFLLCMSGAVEAVVE